MLLCPFRVCLEDCPTGARRCLVTRSFGTHRRGAGPQGRYDSRTTDRLPCECLGPPRLVVPSRLEVLVDRLQGRPSLLWGPNRIHSAIQPRL
jgi:hypothetical protein